MYWLHIVRLHRLDSFFRAQERNVLDPAQAVLLWSCGYTRIPSLSALLEGIRDSGARSRRVWPDSWDRKPDRIVLSELLTETVYCL